ncbi:hypothetical protein [Sphingobacterium sp. SYP-B4668]|uniref:hypothetical protein n=1 Tax=Sphingobacterium sp. SYP-B4668 TaxID=2996035 RepID=UPI0022DDC2E5|nr:hypothetical protein [Sphingobacterium sp. SYP-B4668]
MKSSNKLLIAMAVALLIVPVSMMYVVAKMNRVDATEYTTLTHDETTSLQTKDTYMTTIPLMAFNQVKIKGDGNVLVNLRLVKADKFAIKVSKEWEGAVEHTIDNAGDLELYVKNIHDRHMATISIFSPSIAALSLTNIGLGSFVAEMDTFQIYLNDVSRFHIGDEFKVNKLSVNAVKSEFPIYAPGDGKEERAGGVQELTLDLDSSSVQLGKQHFGKVELRANNSNLIFISDQSERVVTMDTLHVLTTGVCTINIGDTEVKKLSGTLSDETKTDMSMRYIKMFVQK